MRNAAIGLGLSFFFACALRFWIDTPYADLLAMVAFLLTAVFGALLLVGLVSRIGHTPGGVASLAAMAAALCIGVYWWFDLGKALDGVEFDTAVAAAVEPAPEPVHAGPDLRPHVAKAGQ